jgi:hypothetical protein
MGHQVTHLCDIHLQGCLAIVAAMVDGDGATGKPRRHRRHANHTLPLGEVGAMGGMMMTAVFPGEGSMLCSCMGHQAIWVTLRAFIAAQRESIPTVERVCVVHQGRPGGGVAPWLSVLCVPYQSIRAPVVHRKAVHTKGPARLGRASVPCVSHQVIEVTDMLSRVLCIRGGLVGAWHLGALGPMWREIVTEQARALQASGVADAVDQVCGSITIIRTSSSHHRET